MSSAGSVIVCEPRAPVAVDLRVRDALTGEPGRPRGGGRVRRAAGRADEEHAQVDGVAGRERVRGLREDRRAIAPPNEQRRRQQRREAT